MRSKTCLKRLLGLLLFSSVVFANAENQSRQADFVSEYFLEEFQDIQNKISDSKSLSKSTVGEHGGAILDSQALIFPTDRDPLDVALRRTAALLADLKKSGLANSNQFEARLNTIKATSDVGGLQKSAIGSPGRQDLYMETMALQRKIALSNPLMDFDSLLFAATRAPNGGHIVSNYFGSSYGGASGKLCMLTGLKSDNPVVKDILQNSIVENGSLKGKSLGNGTVTSPDLSFDGKTIIFAWNSGGGPFHIFKVNVDGTNLLQLTDGALDDFDPCWLPSGRIAFVTKRRGGYGRCHGWPGYTYTIFSMKDDGSDIYCIDYHETNEWNPSVDNDGKIVYSRWDYVDREAVIAHNMWIMYPDGRDSRSWHGNYPKPWSTIPGTPNYGNKDGILDRPMSELSIRSIPNSTRYIATATGHHTCPYGDLILIDINIPDDDRNAQITGITTNRTSWYDGSPCTYGTAWPLSESYYLCSYQSDLILLDKSGNKQVIIPVSKTPGTGRCLDPIPLRARKKPPEIPIQTFQGERKNLPEHKRAVISVLNVYNSDIPLPAGVKIKEFRIVQLAPKFTQNNEQPKTSYTNQALCRMSMGTAPVEEDGSVYCEAPTGKTLYFQILDDRGCAIQSMRSASWVHDGEHLTCAGCHNDKWKSTPTGQPIAMQRPPSKLKPEYGTSVEPLTFYRTVKPVLDKQCAPCHAKQGKGPNMSYGSLQNYAFCYEGIGWDNVDRPPSNGIYHGSRSTPGKHGALQSGLFSHLQSTHHDVNLSTEEKRRITYWLDNGSMELGAYTRVDEQKAGKLVWPELDCDSSNPQGIESEFPSPDATGIFGGSNMFSAKPLDIRIKGTLVNIANPTLGDVRIALFDLKGRCVYAGTLRQRAALLNVDMRNWRVAPGAYVLKALSEKNSSMVMAAMVR